MTCPTYSPLQEDECEIRILDLLLAEDHSAPIRCRFRHAFLGHDPKPRFAALSYAWGNPNPPSEVAIDGIQHRVSPNLASALRHLRSKSNVISLWADAVCINQADAAEKATQLFIMGEIYRQAERVLVWLGPESEDSNLAMDTIHRWAACKYEHPGRRRGSPTRYSIDIDLDEVFNEAAFGAIMALLARPYWTRVWIQQEVALGRDVYMHCGQRSVLFDVLEQAASSWKDFWFTALDSPDWAHVFHRFQKLVASCRPRDRNKPIAGASEAQSAVGFARSCQEWPGRPK
jgi:hypothetical protein